MSEQQWPGTRQSGPTRSAPAQQWPGQRVDRPAAPAPVRRGTRRHWTDEVAQTFNEVNRSIPGVSELQAYLEQGRQAFREAGEGRGVYGFLKNGRMGQPFTPAAQSWQQARQRQRNMSQDLNTRRPNVAAFTRVTATAAPMLVPGGQGAGVVNATRAGNMARAATVTAAQGAFNRFAIGEGTVQERLARAGDLKAIAGDVAVGGVLGRLTPASPSRTRRASPSVQTLAREGVPMTYGQVAGGAVRRLEDAATSAPIIGNAISNARQRGVEGMNRAQVNRALRPIGQELPRQVETGSDAIAEAAGRFNQRYKDIVPDLGLDTSDQAFANSLDGLRNITADMTDPARAQLQNILNERLVKRVVNGKIDGPTFKRIESELAEQAGRYTKSPDVDQQSIGRGLDHVLDSMRETLAVQNPTYARALADTNKGYSRLASLETAAGKAGVIDGIVTPKQLREGYRYSDKSVRRRATAQGRRPDQEFYDAAAQVLPSQMPDSGTAGRAMNNPLALGGMGALAVAKPEIGIPAVGALGLGAAAYSKPALALFNKALQSNVARRDQLEALEQLGLLASQSPEIMSLYQQAATKLGYGATANSAAGAQVGR